MDGINKVTIDNDKDHEPAPEAIQRRPKSQKKNMTDEEINKGLRKFILKWKKLYENEKSNEIRQQEFQCSSNPYFFESGAHFVKPGCNHMRYVPQW